jgi:DNA polymerase elongation subunit (family B)
MYVDAIHDRYSNTIRIVERINGKRVFNDVPAEYVFYYEHPAGGHRSIFGDTCKRFVTNNPGKFRQELMRKKEPKVGKPVRVFESDINPVFRALAKHYKGCEAPNLHVAFFDIEVNFDPERGYAPPNDPFNSINAISIYANWLGTLFTLALCPPTLSMAEAEAIGAKFENTIIFADESQLLKAFLNVIQDADVLSGWNSEGYDIPYIVNRIARVLGEDATRELCLWNQLPRSREYEKFKKKHTTYDLVGRVHLDYLLLYQKHNTQQLHSYRLDYVGEVEVGENKVPYHGTLDQLYKEDFEKFIAYNRQDTLLLHKIDQNKKYIELSNQIAHANSVLLKTTMGSVALVEQAIINEMHDMGFVVPDRPDREEQPEEEEELEYDEDGDPIPKAVVGAYVAVPKVGLRDWVGAADINSLYPSTIRALNMSPETIVGQCRPVYTDEYINGLLAKGVKPADAWDGIFASLEFSAILDRTDKLITIDWEDGREETRTGAEWHDHIFNPDSHLCITANGTLFRTDRDGIIPALLTRWYADRKAMQYREKFYEDLYYGVSISDELAAEVAAATPGDTASSDRLSEIVERGDPVEIATFMKANKLVIQDGRILPQDEETKGEYKYLTGFWNRRQLARKILLNSLYGALLNKGLRFFDKRLGQSTTLSGRSIVRHMNAKINEVITGVYDYKGAAIQYADTDSCYFSVYEAMKDDPAYANFTWTKENVIELYDAITEVANASFPEFMMRTFNTTFERGSYIKAGREIVATKALFIKKKKYACLVYDKEGKRKDRDGKPGEIKAMGLDLKRADTPKFMQTFLNEFLLGLLTGLSRDELNARLKEFRRAFAARPGWEKGTPKGVKALSDYADRQEATENKAMLLKALRKGEKSRIDMPGHVRASINWNKLLDIHNDLYSMRIGDGSKVIVCKLKPNVFNMDSVAYPIDEPHLPKWFKELPFDHAAMEATIIDNKILNLVGVLDWDLTPSKDLVGDDELIFLE